MRTIGHRAQVLLRVVEANDCNSESAPKSFGDKPGVRRGISKHLIEIGIVMPIGRQFTTIKLYKGKLPQALADHVFYKGKSPQA